eukprot:sb/3476989/
MDVFERTRKTDPIFCTFSLFDATFTVLEVTSQPVEAQIANISHPKTIVYRLSTTGAEETIPVFFQQRLKNIGNPVQQQREWVRENSLAGTDNIQMPISGIIFRSKIAREKQW